MLVREVDRPAAEDLPGEAVHPADDVLPRFLRLVRAGASVEASSCVEKPSTSRYPGRELLEGSATSTIALRSPVPDDGVGGRDRPSRSLRPPVRRRTFQRLTCSPNVPRRQPFFPCTFIATAAPSVTVHVPVTTGGAERADGESPEVPKASSQARRPGRCPSPPRSSGPRSVPVRSTTARKGSWPGRRTSAPRRERPGARLAPARR